MLYIREVSDLHLEFYYDLYDSVEGLAKQELEVLIPPRPTDSETVLIVAGDLATARRARRIATFMELVVPRFMHVIFVLGNHEHYGCRLNESEQLIKDAIAANGRIDAAKLTIAGNSVEVVEIDGVTFYCTTLWADYNGGNPVSAMTIERYITDHRTIRMDDDSRFTVQHAHALHKKLRVELMLRMGEKDEHSRSVVVTHHMPTYQAVHEMYRRDEPAITLNAAFAANMEDVISTYQPAYWFFGHTHTPYVGQFGRTTLVCNPLGYPNESNQRKGWFDPTYTTTVK